jgi:hypothetical protein
VPFSEGRVIRFLTDDRVLHHPFTKVVNHTAMANAPPSRSYKLDSVISCLLDGVLDALCATTSNRPGSDSTNADRQERHVGARWHAAGGSRKGSP